MQYNGQYETLRELQNRIGAFSVTSMYLNQEGKFVTNANLPNKVNEDGKMNPFVGNTVVFTMHSMMENEEADAVKRLKEIQTLLYSVPGIKRMLAERLKTDTFHMTLHDLENGVPGEDVFLEERICSTGKKAKAILERAKQGNDITIEMKASRLFNMMNTSVVLGLEPCTEADCQKLMQLYHEFNEAKHLGYPLTPHITMAYYRPGVYDAGTAQLLQKLMDLVNSVLNDETEGEEKAEIRFVFKISDLRHQYFNNMNFYYEV